MAKYKLSNYVTIIPFEENYSHPIPEKHLGHFVLMNKKLDREYLINPTVKYFLDKFGEAKTSAKVLKEIQADVKSSDPGIKKIFSPFFSFLCKAKILVPEHTNEILIETKPLFNPGDCIDQYTITKLLSENKFTELYLATDRANNSPIVIKLVNSKRTANRDIYDEEVSELEREFGMLKETEHIAGISKAYNCNKDNPDYVYLTLEYIPGISLKRYINNTKDLAEKTSLKIIEQILEAFSKLHQSNIIHGDVHGSNLLIMPGDTVKIIDFGLSGRANAEDSEIVSFGGADHYMPPERINITSINKHSKEPDLLSDVYQLGLLIYLILYGKLPFYGFIWEELAENIKESIPGFAEVSFSGYLVNEQLIRIMKKCLSKSPASRYENAGEILSDFKKYVSREKEQTVN